MGQFETTILFRTQKSIKNFCFSQTCKAGFSLSLESVQERTSCTDAKDNFTPNLNCDTLAIMILSSKQSEKLAELCLDLAKGLFLAALAVPAISSVVTLLISLRMLFTAVFFTYLSLIFIKIKEV